jgi:hypothetical protein
MRWNVLVLVACSLFLISFASAAIPADCDPNMVSYWKFDTAAIGAEDALGLNDGVLNGGGSAGTVGLPVLGSLSSPLGATVSISQSSTLEPSSGLTIEFWFESAYPFAAMPSNSLVKKIGYNFSISSEDTFSVYLNDTSLTSAGVIYETNSNYFITLTWDGTEAKFYINGTLEDTQPLTSIAYGDDSLILGEGYWGNIDEVAIYNRSLTQAEITKHFMNSSDGLDYCYSPEDTIDEGTVTAEDGSATRVDFSTFGCVLSSGEKIAYGGCSLDGQYYCDASAREAFNTIDVPDYCGLVLGDCCPAERVCVERTVADHGDGSYGAGEFCYPRLNACSVHETKVACEEDSCYWVGSDTEGICFDPDDSALSCSLYTPAGEESCEEDQWNLGTRGAGSEICGTFLEDMVIPRSCRCEWNGTTDGNCVFTYDIIEESHDGNPRRFTCQKSFDNGECIEGDQFVEWFVTPTNILNYPGGIVPVAILKAADCEAGNVTRSCGEPIVKLPGFGMMNVLVAVCLLSAIYFYWRRN